MIRGGMRAPQRGYERLVPFARAALAQHDMALASAERHGELDFDYRTSLAGRDHVLAVCQRTAQLRRAVAGQREAHAARGEAKFVEYAEGII